MSKVVVKRKKRLRHMIRPRRRYLVCATWRVDLTYLLCPNFVELDRKVIFPAAALVIGGKGYSHGSGGGGLDRDHDWNIRDKSMALRLVRALKKIAKYLPSPRITLWPPPKVMLDVPVPKARMPRVTGAKLPKHTRSAKAA